MAELFRDVTELKTAVGGAVNKSFSIKSIEPYVAAAARKHLTPFLGDAFYEEIVAAYDNNDTEAKYKLLWPHVQKALGFLAIYEYFPMMSVQVSDTGLHRSENEHKKTAFKYQENNYRESMLENGYEAVELLEKYLIAKKADFPTWTSADEYQKVYSIFLNNATAFRNHYSKQISRYTFEQMRALIEDVQAFAIESTFPQAAYEDLKTKFAAGTFTTEEKKALGMIRKAMASFVIEEAMTRNLFVVKGTRLVQYEGAENQTAKIEKTPADNHIGVAKRAADIWANRHMSYLKRYLTNNISAFPQFWNEASGGTNTDDDAWTTEEDEETTTTSTSGNCSSPCNDWTRAGGYSNNAKEKTSKVVRF